MTVATLQLDDVEVTAGAYAAYVASGACAAAEAGGHCNGGKAEHLSHPINCVDYAQAELYCRWRGGRLPMEEEWHTPREAATDVSIHGAQRSPHPRY